jgi:hypothetical protein
VPVTAPDPPVAPDPLAPPEPDVPPVPPSLEELHAETASVPTPTIAKNVTSFMRALPPSSAVVG